MKFLHEEFFGKVYDYIKNINVFLIRVLAKLLFWGIIFGLFGLLVWFYYAGKINLIIWIVGILFAAEVAHYLRKSMERRLNMKEEEAGNIQDQLVGADVIRKSKKKVLLKKGEVVNKAGLLKKKKVIVAPAGVPFAKGKKEKVVNKAGLFSKE